MTDSDQRNHPANDDQAMVLTLRPNDNRGPRAWGGEHFSDGEPLAPDEAFTGDLAAGVTSLGFIRAAIRRRVRLWGALALIGLIIGLILCVARPAPHQATTSLLIANPPDSTPGVTVQNDTAIVQSRTVAAGALRRLGLTESPTAFVRQYTSTVVTDQVLDITVTSSSAADAVSKANALARAFLSFQARLLQTQEDLVNASLDQRLGQAEQNVSSMTAQISGLLVQPGSQARVRALQVELTRAQDALAALKEAVAGNAASTQVATTVAIQGSQVLDPAVAVRPSTMKRLVLYGGGGLLGGLAVGLAIVVIGALTSERLRRRDDISRALGAPVRLSVSAQKPGRARASLLDFQSQAIRRVAGHLAAVLPTPTQGPASLALVPVDDVAIPAMCLASLAVSCAKQDGTHVVVADLCQGAPLARFLDVGQPGIHQASIDGVQLVVAVPDVDDLPPEGPLCLGPTHGTTPSSLAAACQEADLLLTLAPLDPATGGDYLRSWAQTIAVTVTAGRSSAARINAVGEMVRLAGLPLVSAVLLGADKADESLGVHTAVAGGDLRAVGLARVAGPEMSS